MFGWLKKLFGDDNAPTLEKPIVTPTVEAAKPKTKKKSTATTGRKTTSKSADLDAMSKTQLIEHAKKKGVKVNASMKKADLVKKIKNG
jgi:hypothetical protein